MVWMRNVCPWTSDYQSFVRMRPGWVMHTVKVVINEELEEQEPEVPSRADMVEDGRPLGLIVVRSKTVYQVVIVAHIELWDESICNTKLAASEQSDIMATDKMQNSATVPASAVNQNVRKVVPVDGKFDLIGERHLHFLLRRGLGDPVL